MSTLTYRLQIACRANEHEAVSSILGVTPNSVGLWEFEITENKSEFPQDGIAYFVSVLKGKYQKLASVGVRKTDISIWLIYAYQGQCNLEFTPNQLALLSREGISLCISCYEVQ